MKKIFLILAACLFIYSCNNEVEVITPVVDASGFLDQTYPLPENVKPIMEGVYEVTAGTDLLGDQVVVKWNRDRLSIFAGKNGGYIVLESGYLDSVLFFFGYWRYSTNTETGSATFYIPSDEGGSEILSGDSTFTTIKFIGSYGVGNELAAIPLVLKYKRPFSQKVKESNFEILAHRGGGRNSDYLGVSENSIEMINIAERFGTTGIEIDARLSRDGVPFIYHDGDINLRLTQKSLIWGNIEDFTWAQLRTLVTLRNGEKIPSLREALEFTLEETNIKTVWLDTKDVDVVPASIALLTEINERAVLMGRDLKIYLGIPADDVYDKFLEQPNYQDVPSLCELSIDQVREANSMIWAPRWTQGTQTSTVQQMQAEGRKVFTWTLDDENYIEQFINEGQFDGILTNYPTIVSYFHYIQD
ncbi:MAG: glycerophosphodiester phosphodiesterase [Ignavibacteriaceae bacterium]|nr:glycerophosphodiester phosphodiesterase [Ignavibacteriaceae bacterium]